MRATATGVFPFPHSGGRPAPRGQLRLLLIVLNGDKKQNLPVSVTEARAESYSSGDDTVVVSLRTKYSTKERKYCIPVECLRDLIGDLKRSNSVAAPQSDKPTEKTKNLLPEILLISELRRAEDGAGNGKLSPDQTRVIEFRS